MTRVCQFCKSALKWVDGDEQSARERGGNARERDTFQCTGCTREYRHSVSERFSGDTHWWGIRQRGESSWQDLDEADWPQFD